MIKKNQGLYDSLVISTIITTLVILTLALGFKYYKKYYNYENAFDQMFYTRIDNDYFLNPDTGMFGNMDQLEYTSRDMENFNDEYGLYDQIYKDSELEENQRLIIGISKKSKTISFYTVWTYHSNSKSKYEEDLWLNYEYDLNTKTLTKGNIELRIIRTNDHTITTEDPEIIEEFLKRRNLTWADLDKMQEEFFYDKFLIDWFDANKFYTKFSKDDLGDVNIASDKDENLRNILKYDN